MERLPVELWTKTSKDLSKQGLVAACGTCHLFCNVAQPVLYRDIHITEDRHSSGDLFCRTVTSRENLAVHVHILILDLWSSPCVKSLLEKITSFQNLRVLKLDEIRIDSDLYDDLQTLPLLKSVAFGSCGVSDDLSKFSRNGRDGSMSDVSIIYPSGGEWWPLIPLGIRSLYLATSNESIRVAEDTISVRGLSMLTALEPYDTIPRNIIPFLVACPQLRRVLIITSSLHPELCSLPSDAIPLLEDFGGWVEYAARFITGRPVHTAVIRLPETNPGDILQCLQFSSVPLTKLELYAKTLTFEDLWHLPATLHHFGWRDNDMPEELYTALSNISILRVLKNTSLTSIPFAIRKQMVHAAASACRSLSEFIFEVYYPAQAEKAEETWIRARNLDWCIT